MKIKVVFNQDIRRWRSSQENVSFETVQAFVRECWGDLPTNFGLSFRDEEGDQITITNDADLEEALLIAREDCRTSLKIVVTDSDDAPGFIVLGGRDSSDSSDDVYDMAVGDESNGYQDMVAQVGKDMDEASATKSDNGGQPEETPRPDVEAEQPEEQPSCRILPSEVVNQDSDMTVEPAETEQPGSQINVDTAMAVMEAAQDAEPEEEEEQPQEEPPASGDDQKDGEQPQPASLKELVQQFFGDEGIMAQLPDAVDIIFESLRNNEPVQVAIDLVFATFEGIHQHPLVQRVLPFLPAYLPKLQSVAPFILLVGPEKIKEHLKQVLELVQRCCVHADGDTVDIRPFMRNVCPNMINLMESRMPTGTSEDVPVEQLLSHFGMAMPDLEGRATEELQREQASRNSPVEHKGVTCDGCGVSPIVGARFKSAVLADYDLCAKCEETGVNDHPREYPMIKFSAPVQDIQEGVHFKGLGEFYWQQKKRRCGRGRGRCGWGGRRGRGRGRRGRFGRWARPDWAADRANQQNDDSQSSNGGWGWGGPYDAHQHGPHGPPHCPPWMMNPKKMEWMAKHWGQHWGQQHGGPPAWAQRQENLNKRVAKLKAAFLSDVTIPDRSTHGSDLTLIKTWKMRNTGATAWEGCYLSFVKGDKSLIAGIDDTSLNGRFPVARVEPSAMAEVSATVQTPTKSGRYCAYFKLHGPDGTRFGPQIWIDIKVENEAEQLQRAISASSADVDMAPTKQQVKRAQQQAKKVQKLDGLRRKLHKKLEKLERREQKIRSRTDDANAKPKKIAKLEKRASKVAAKQQRLAARLVDATVERNERASTVEQLYAPITQEPTAAARPTTFSEEKDAEAEINIGVQAMSMDDPVIVSTDEPTENPAPSAPPAAFEYQEQLDQVQAFGFGVEPNVIRYLLTENKGNVGAVVNHLLASTS